jgi:hypothetical protein
MLPKPSRTARRKEELASRRALVRAEDQAKAAVRRRDRVCRFPLCGCHRLRLRLEVAHLTHKGSGGNPTGTRNVTGNLLLLCSHRHQHGALSLHHGTLVPVPLTGAGADGPIRWMWKTNGQGELRELAREYQPGRLEMLTPWQWERLRQLADMTE